MRGVGDELPDLLLAAVACLQGRLDVVEHGVEGGADLPDLGPLVGEVVGDPLAEVDLAGGQRQLRHPVGCAGDLAQRRELAAYDDRAGDRCQRDAQERGQQLEPDQVGNGLVHLGLRQARDEASAADLLDPDPVGTESRDVRGAQVAPGVALGYVRDERAQLVVGVQTEDRRSRILPTTIGSLSPA